MTGRKQQLLKRHRRNKRVAMIVALLVLLASGVMLAWWIPPVLLVAGWIAHEAWFADHLFYSPRDDYQHEFPGDCLSIPARLEQGVLRVDENLDSYDTLILELQLKATWLGRWLDPVEGAGHGGVLLHGSRVTNRPYTAPTDPPTAQCPSFVPNTVLDRLSTVPMSFRNPDKRSERPVKVTAVTEPG